MKRRQVKLGCEGVIGSLTSSDLLTIAVNFKLELLSCGVQFCVFDIAYVAQLV